MKMNALAILMVCLMAQSKGNGGETVRWTQEKANDWYTKQPWLVGCNFLPSTAVNDIEMWQADTFDPATIKRELGWAHGLGFNTVRVFVNYVVWENDPVGLKRRMAQFLDIANKCGIRTMFVLFDDCNFAGSVATVGKQPDPIPGVQNSQWVSSPPLKMVADPVVRPKLERYVKDIIRRFANDRRVVIWDLYNEPGNSNMGEKSTPLLESAFAWAREMKPSQPLTIGAWADFRSNQSKRMMELSDVVTFHGYDKLDGIKAKAAICREYGRPVLCTEYLLRQGDNNFQTMLPYFHEENIGCYNWGLVAGRTQTYFHGGSPPGTAEPKVWQHDIFHKDGTPFDEKEIVLIKKFTLK